MLVLTRKEDERIRIGDDIVITVIKMEGGRVRVGIEAPSKVLVLRGELKQKKVEQSDCESTPILPYEPSSHPLKIGRCS